MISSCACFGGSWHDNYNNISAELYYDFSILTNENKRFSMLVLQYASTCIRFSLGVYSTVSSTFSDLQSDIV